MMLAVSLVLGISVAAFYFEVLQTGSNVKSIKGVIISLAPSIVLSLVAWFTRKKISAAEKITKSLEWRWGQVMMSLSMQHPRTKKSASE